MNMARISRGIALGLALALLAEAPALAASVNNVTSTPSTTMNSEWSLKEGNVDNAPQVTAKAFSRVDTREIGVELQGQQGVYTLKEMSEVEQQEQQQAQMRKQVGQPQILPQIQQQIQQEREQREQQTQWVGPGQEEEQQGTPVRVLPASEGKYAQVITVLTGRAESLHNALDATKSFSADQVETLAGIAEKLLDTAKGSGMSAETLRQLLTDLQTTPRNQWLGLLLKYKPSPALTAAVLEAVRQIESLNLGVTLSTEEALALADALLKALEEGWTPQWIATIKTMRESFGDIQAGDAIQIAAKKLKATETFLSDLAVKVGTDGAAARLPANLNIQKKGDALRPAHIPGGVQPGPNPGLNPAGPALSTIRGGLANNYGGTGNYGFVVNLSSGDIRDGFMNGDFGSSGSFDVSGGGGTVNGNDFALSGFTGTLTIGVPENIASATLDGTAAQGFGSVGDIGASGNYTITGSSGTSDFGSITSGQRVN